MTESNLTTAVRMPADGVGVIDIVGDVNARAENALMDAFGQASSGTSLVILNFAGLEYMNSGGIGLLVTLLIRANRQSQTLVAVGLSEHYRHIFELTRLNEAIRVFDTETAAMSAMSAGQ